MSSALSYDTLKTVVAHDTVLTMYDRNGVQTRMDANLLRLKTVFGLEKCALKFPKDEEGLYRIHINVRCEPAFFFALQLAYKRLTHQGDASLIRNKHQKAEIKLVAALSLSGVKIILYFAKFYGMRGVYEELERLVCNNDFLRYCHSERTGRNIQRYFASKSKKPANPTKGGNGFQQYVTGLSPYETGLYLVNLELAKQRQELKAAQLAVYHASLDETIDKKVNRKKIPVPPAVRWSPTVDIHVFA